MLNFSSNVTRSKFQSPRLRDRASTDAAFLRCPRPSGVVGPQPGVPPLTATPTNTMSIVDNTKFGRRPTTRPRGFRVLYTPPKVVRVGNAFPTKELNPKRDMTRMPHQPLRRRHPTPPHRPHPPSPPASQSPPEAVSNASRRARTSPYSGHHPTAHISGSTCERRGGGHKGKA